MVDMDMAVSLAIVMVIMLVTELIAKLTRGKLPQMFLMALVFLIGFWTILPKDIIERSTLDTVANITKIIILIHIATMFDIKSLLKEWRAVVTTLAAMAGIAVFVFGISAIFYDTLTALVTVPPLMGGMVAAWLMNDASLAIGRMDLGLLVMIVWIMQAFAGYPITAFLLRKEGKRLLGEYHEDADAAIAKYGGKMPDLNAAEEGGKKRLIDRVPAIIKSPTFYITEMLLLAGLAAGLSMLLQGWLDMAVCSLIVGVAAKFLGLIDDAPLDKAQSSGILFIALYVSFMSSFSTATVSDVLATLVPVIVLIAASTVGILLFAMPVGKLLGYSPYLAGAIGLNCYLGFPVNYALTTEAISFLTKDEQEAEFLKGSLMSKMIIGGVVSVTTVSAIIAGIFVGFMT